MRHKFILVYFIITLLVITGCNTYKSLDEAIQSKWKSPIKVLLIDKMKNTVVFLDQDQYVFNTFKKNGDKYIYSTDGEDGWTFTADSGLTPFLFRSLNTKTAGNVFWGAIKTDKDVETVEVTYTNINASDSQIKVKIPVVDNVFIGYPTRDFFDSDLTLSGEWKLSAKAFDEDGNIVAAVTGF
ncbi:hypothetical protein [Paenibacillus gansuensis]|uniref:Lipoprotein n=1 Tax=Paenibacillus gansuensis TaxID=306542 RepID=A0ABW5PLP4_9BACL